MCDFRGSYAENSSHGKTPSKFKQFSTISKKRLKNWIFISIFKIKTGSAALRGWEKEGVWAYGAMSQPMSPFLDKTTFCESYFLRETTVYMSKSV